MTLRKAGANWVEGDRFFDREVELEALTERVKDGTHALLTAQRRMGKTSLVRELQRRLQAEGEFETVFVDLEAAANPEDVITEIGVQSRRVQGAWAGIKSGFANLLKEVGDRVDTLSVSELQVKLRAGIDAGNWRQKGDEVFAARRKHYESRLKTVLGREAYRVALEILTEAAVEDGRLRSIVIDLYREHLQDRARIQADADPVPVDDVLYVLEHDGYLERQDDGYRFVSGLLEDWWRARHGRHFVPIEQR